MDVALDANQYLSDPKMNGVQFSNLPDYLKKAGSKLIIPHVVRDEALARYADRIQSMHSSLTSKADALQRLLFTRDIVALRELDIGKQVEEFKNKLSHPSPYVDSVFVDYAGVTVEEVVRRGIQRIRPANNNGEQLRDVVLWLTLLEYMKTQERELAFISKDGDFLEQEYLHPTLSNEVRSLRFHFATSIEEFIKTHAPSPIELGEEQAYTFCSKQLVLDNFEIALRYSFPMYWSTEAQIIGVKNPDVSFRGGKLYTVSESSRYGELDFAGVLDAEVRVIREPTFDVASFSPTLADLLQYQQTGVWLPAARHTQAQLSLDIRDAMSSDLPRVPAGEVIVGPSVLEIRQVRFNATFVLSLRIVGEKVETIEIENFRFTAGGS